MSGSRWLLVAGSLSLVAAVLHLAVIVGGPDWYRFFGAGEAMAQADERRSWTPAMVTFGIAAILSVWAAYAFAGAGAIRRLPLMRTALVLISAIYLLRGLFVLNPSAFSRPDLSSEFMLWSSLIVLVFGLTYAVGTWLTWPHLSKRNAS